MPNFKTICIDSGTVDLKRWPVGQAISMWNANGKNYLQLNQSSNCDGTVTLSEDRDPSYSGSTQFFATARTIHINLSDLVPAWHTLYTVVHELGHVLGLPHDHDNGAMNISCECPYPSPREMMLVGKNLWDFDVASRQQSGV